MDIRSPAPVQVIVSAIVTTCLCLAGCGKAGPGSELHKLRFALPSNDWWTSAPFIVAKNRPIFQQHLLDMEFIQVDSGLASKNAVLAGTADFGVSAATPLALAAARGEPVVVLAQYFHSSVIVGLVGPKGEIGFGVPPEPVVIVPSTISESFLYSYLAHIEKQQLVEKKELRELIARPADVTADLKTGSARSAAIWEPFLSIAAGMPGMAASTGGIDFDVSLFLVSRSEARSNRRDDVLRLLAGLQDACDYITQHPDEARSMVEGEFSFQPGFLKLIWPKVNYKVQFDAATIRVEIGREGRIMNALGTIDSQPDLSKLVPSNTQLR
jgi:ABC-type nitrate/sulfonate/bicarbonate transport system substrate-binding protein